MTKKGFISIISILTIAGFMFIMMFLGVDYLNAVIVRQVVLNVTDEAVEISATRIDRAELSKGNVDIYKSEAEEIVKNILKKQFSLNDDLTPTSNSYLKSAPVVTSYISNLESSAGYEYANEKSEVIILYNPTIIITVEVDQETLLFKKNFTILARSQTSIKFNDKKEPIILTSSGNPDADINVTLSDSVNPHRFYETNPFQEVGGYFGFAPMASGGRQVIGIEFKDDVFVPEEIKGYLHIKKYSVNVDYYTNTRATYQAGTIVVYKDKFYSCILTHAVNGMNNLAPDVAVDLWKEVNEAVPTMSYNIPFEFDKVIDGSLLRLDTVPSPNLNKTGTFKITNPYPVDVAVNWIQNSSAGTVIAKAESVTYFEVKNELIVTSAYGDLLENGVLYPLQIKQNPRRYVPVDSNNGTGFSNVSGYKGASIIPYEAPDGSIVSVTIQATGISSGVQKSYSSTRVIGKVEHNLLSLLKFE